MEETSGAGCRFSRMCCGGCEKTEMVGERKERETRSSSRKYGAAFKKRANKHGPFLPACLPFGL